MWKQFRSISLEKDVQELVSYISKENQSNDFPSLTLMFTYVKLRNVLLG